MGPPPSVRREDHWTVAVVTVTLHTGTYIFCKTAIYTRFALHSYACVSQQHILLLVPGKTFLYAVTCMLSFACCHLHAVTAYSAPATPAWTGAEDMQANPFVLCAYLRFGF